MRSLLFTGATGFLGTNIYKLLASNYQIDTIGLTPRDDYQVNIANDIPKLIRPYDIVLHAAGKAHSVPKTQDEAKAFFDVNFTGTKNLCYALEKCAIPKSFIFISTVAVYGCDSGVNISENYPLNGITPYALSKIKAEEYLTKWCIKHNVILSILRPSLIAGPNPPGNLGAMINGIRNGRYFAIGGNKSRKSILMVQDIANLVPMLVERGGVFNICDSLHPSFEELEQLISQQLDKSRPFSIPYIIAKAMAFVGDSLGKSAPINSSKLSKITKSLTFSNEKAIKELGWKPLNVLENFKIE